MKQYSKKTKVRLNKNKNKEEVWKNARMKNPNFCLLKIYIFLINNVCIQIVTLKNTQIGLVLESMRHKYFRQACSDVHGQKIKQISTPHYH